jgi:hypothetical protein
VRALRPFGEILADIDSSIRRLEGSPLAKVEPSRSALATLKLNREALAAIHQTVALNTAAPVSAVELLRHGSGDVIL